MRRGNPDIIGIRLELWSSVLQVLLLHLLRRNLNYLGRHKDLL